MAALLTQSQVDGLTSATRLPAELADVLHGLRIQHALRPDACLQGDLALRQQPLDLILCDWPMPGVCSATHRGSTLGDI